MKIYYKQLLFYAKAANARDSKDAIQRLEDARPIVTELTALLKTHKYRHLRSFSWVLTYMQAFLVKMEKMARSPKANDERIAKELLLQICETLDECLRDEEASEILKSGTHSPDTLRTGKFLLDTGDSERQDIHYHS